MTKPVNITTKTGDRGTTKNYSGETVPKDCQQMITIGKIDSLSSFLGIVRAKLGKREDVKQDIRHIQSRLIYLMGEIATDPFQWVVFRGKKENICEKDIVFLEEKSEEIREILGEEGYKIDGWILYGDEGEIAAYIDHAKNICREAEIEINKYKNSLSIKLNSDIVIYINRLSDYLYWVARLLRNFPKN